MRTEPSKAGSTIAFDSSGDGPPGVIVAGALGGRFTNAPLAELLTVHFAVLNYDRRGRGDSGDAQNYAVEREIEDLEAIIGEAGGSAFVFGSSSGGNLALRYDAESGKYTSHFFDSQGHLTVDELRYDDGKWVWIGERIRTTSTFSDDGKVQHSLHEQSDDGVEWRPAMDVTLRRVD
jgi:pimeloyl-ACP methyl ester carboxylesterase